MKHHNYFVYICTNASKSTLYTGVANDLERRMAEHKQEASGSQTSFAGRYKCFYLMYYEYYRQIEEAIGREKFIKSLSRAKKVELIQFFNPQWLDLLNESLVVPVWTLEMEDMRPW